MSDFQGFSEAARLYAENVEVVRAMAAEFRRDETRYLDAVADQIRLKIAPAFDQNLFHEKPTPGYRTWWIGDTTDEFKPFPRQYVKTDSPEVVSSGKVVVHVQTGVDKPAELKARVANLRDHQPLKELAQPKKSQDKWDLFTYEVAIGEGDPVEKLAAPLAMMAIELFTIFQIWQAEQAPNSST